MKYILSVLFVVVEVVCNAQRSSLEFGDVPMEDLKSTRCSIDSSAAAVILFDELKVSLTNFYKYERHTRIKFFGSTAIERWANVNMIYDRNDQKVSKIRAATYNLVDGKIVTTEFDPENTYKTKVNRRLSKISFALPKVMPGSVIEYTYTLTSIGEYKISNLIGSIFGANMVDLSWQFQHEIPVYRCKYTYNGPYSAAYVQSNIPVESSKPFVKRGILESSWTVKNVPAFHEEPYSIPQSDIIGKIFIDHHEKTWSQVGGLFTGLQEYGLTEKDSSLVRQLGGRFKSIKDLKVRTDTVVRYVKKMMKWTKEVDRYPDHQFGDSFISGVGSSCEINLVLMAILKKAGLTAHPVMISTRENGVISFNRPRSDQLDDLIVLVTLPKSNENNEETFLFLDATSRSLSNDFIPLRCLNSFGLKIDGKNSSLINVGVPRSKVALDAKLHLNEKENLLEGEAKLSFTGLKASEERDAYFSLGDEKYDEKLGVNYPAKNEPFKVKNMTSADRPFELTFGVKSVESVRSSNDVLYLNPFSLFKEELNFLKSDTRLSPVDLNPPHERIFVVTIEVPPNFTIDEVPKPGAFSYPMAEPDLPIMLLNTIIPCT